MRKALPVVLLALAALAAGAWLLGRGGGEAIRYETVAIDRGTVQRIVSSSGAVRALVTVEVGSQLSGQIAEVRADFNAVVRQGELLAVIDPQTFRTRVASAQANLAVAEANLGTERAALRKAETVLAQARRDLDRQLPLAERGLIATSALEETRKALELAEADLEIARARVRNADSVLAQRRAELEQARIDLSRTEIRSPIDGVVIERSVDAGQTVAASLQAPVLFRIAQDLSRVRIEAKVDEADIGGITAGATATFTVDAFPDREFHGRVAQVRLAATEAQNVVTYTVIVEADNPEQQLLPGMTANVRILVGRRENVVRVPNAALRFRPAGVAADAGPGESARGGMLQDLGERLDLSAAQRTQLEATLREGREAPTPDGADPAARRARFENALRRLLTPEQIARYEAGRDERRAADGRPGTVWVLEQGEPVARRVRIGLADETHSELLGEDLAPGAAVIVRAGQGSAR
jgi:HlyD family secretion protein